MCGRWQAGKRLSMQEQNFTPSKCSHLFTPQGKPAQRGLTVTPSVTASSSTPRRRAPTAAVAAGSSLRLMSRLPQCRSLCSNSQASSPTATVSAVCRARAGGEEAGGAMFVFAGGHCRSEFQHGRPTGVRAAGQAAGIKSATTQAWVSLRACLPA